MSYHFNDIEAKWQKYWAENKTFQATNPPLSGELEGAPKYYVLDMFPYPSGAGLHVGHPLGYIASDIYARYKRHKGFNVLHPQGYDSFGLPAEQYAIQTGQHPKSTTEINIDGCLDEKGNILDKYVNEDGSIKDEALIEKGKSTTIKDKNYRENIIKGYRKQLDKIGFSFDWSREVRTSDPKFYKWTQWIFIQLYNSWYNKETDKAEDVSSLVSVFSTKGNATVNASADEDIQAFTAKQWNTFSEKEQQEILSKYRLTYLSETEVNWCPALGTVLANDEIVNGVSERGGHPVVRKKMKQWSMRITAYAQRLLDGLNTIDWPQPLKDSQTNWIGKSVGATVTFPILSFPEGEEKADSENQDKESSSLGEGFRMRGYMTGGNNSHLLIEKAQEMRANPTPAEAVLWQQLKSKQLENKFRQQHLIDDFIVDFVCLSKKLIVEVDGKIHDEQVDKDQERTDILNKLGYKVIRFKNEEVIGKVNEVITKIKKELKSAPLSFGKRLGDRISVFTTRPDTIFGVSFMTLAPEHELVSKITTPDQKEAVDNYVQATAKRSERERMADVKTISGVFTGAYAEHPFTKESIPVWIGDYVLAGYGTGAVMSVPCGDQRDYDFAKHFDIPIPNIFDGVNISEEAFADKEKTIISNSDFLNGMNYKKATKRAIYELEQLGQGTGKINYRLRDAVFSRQRYWGEPFPVYYKDGLPQMIDEKHLPIRLPEVEKYLPTEDGKPPLGNATHWAWNTNNNEIVSNDLLVIPTEGGTSDEESHNGIYPLELNTMPGWAGSSYYFNRYMDAHNEDEIFSKEAIDYWQDVDLYIGGSEHATGHLLYSRFWQKFLFDKGIVPKDEYAKKLINQGMILGTSAFVYRFFFKEKKEDHLFISNLLKNLPHIFLPKDYAGGKYIGTILSLLKGEYSLSDDEIGKLDIAVIPNRVDISLLIGTTDELDIKRFRKDDKYKEYKGAIFIGEKGEIIDGDNDKYICGREVEKMSKSKYNVVNPDAICEQYGADSLRLYEMFLGPLEQAKPWNTAGITGVHGFLKKLWKLYSPFTSPEGGKLGAVSPPSGESEGASGEGLKVLHKTIKKVEEDIENFSFNTSVSTFMIAVNELTAQKCTSRDILEPLLVLISPYAPHIAEELWSELGHTESISTAPFPVFEEKYLVESSKTYPISFNGKMRFTMELSLDLSKEEIETAVMAHEKTQAQLQGRTPKKVIVVPGKIVNIVG